MYIVDSECGGILTMCTCVIFNQIECISFCDVVLTSSKKESSWLYSQLRKRTTDIDFAS